MLDPPALHSHMSHIWLPLIRRFTYTPQGMFVHIAPRSTMRFIGVAEREWQVETEAGKPACVRACDPHC